MSDFREKVSVSKRCRRRQKELNKRGNSSESSEETRCDEVIEWKAEEGVESEEGGPMRGFERMAVKRGETERQEEEGGCSANSGGGYLDDESTGDEWQIKKERRAIMRRKGERKGEE